MTRVGQSVMAVAAIAAVQAIATSPAHANHVPGASYTGTTDAGGEVDLDVDDSGDSVAFGVLDVPTSCGSTGDLTAAEFVPITTSPTGVHVFTDGLLFPFPLSTGLSYDGSFPAPGVATGTLSFSTASAGAPPLCKSADIGWSASEDVDTQSAASQAAAIKKCKKIRNKKKRKKCLRKLRKQQTQ